MFYIHKIKLSDNRSVILISDTPKPKPTYTYLNGSPIVDSDGNRVANKINWTLGAIETENESKRLAIELSKFYGCDILKDGKLLGLPQMGDSGKWVDSSTAASALGSIRTAKKSASSAENGKRGGRPRKNQNVKE